MTMSMKLNFDFIIGNKKRKFFSWKTTEAFSVKFLVKKITNLIANLQFIPLLEDSKSSQNIE